MSYDVLVIGSGPGGYVAAVRCAQLGLSTACVEKDFNLGGTCLNVGCIPSKTLLQSSEGYEWMLRKAPELGLSAEKVSFQFERMMRRKDEVVRGLVDSVVLLFNKHKIDSIHGTARFISPNEIEAVRRTYKAKNFIIATGSEPVDLHILPFDERLILSSTGALNLTQVPSKLIVIGAGVIGVELASVYKRLGSQVTVIEMMDVICAGMDKAISKTLLSSLKKQGISFLLGTKVKDAQRHNDGVVVHYEGPEGAGTVEGDKVLVAIGRRPFTEGLDLDKIGIETDERGFVPVDGCYRTKQPHIYAIGDIITGPMLAHRASEEGVAVAEFISGMKSFVNNMAIPNVIYTNPEVATVGLTEQDVVGKLELIIGTAYFRGNARARCAGETEGLVKILGDKKSGRLIGMHIVGPHASEMIGEGVAAIEKKMTVNELAHMPHAHPTLTEAIKEAAQSALGWGIHS